MGTIMRLLGLLGGSGLREAARNVANEGADALAERMELAELEWQELRRFGLLLLAGSLLLAVLLMVALLLGSVAFLVHFWEGPHRVAVAWSVAGFWLFAASLTALALARLVRRAPSAFAMTREELARDWAMIKESL
jgi:uncharacterized membrane protein YqjE